MSWLDLDTAAGFLSERRDFLHITAAPSLAGDGWDVLLRVDGTYAERGDAEAAAVELRDWIERLRDVRADGRTWWHGPPIAHDSVQGRYLRSIGEDVPA